jgi:S1-C subfamily serine protease
MSPAFDAEIETGHVLLEINRRPVRSYEDFRRLTANVRPGDVLALYLYKPDPPRRELHTVKVD